MSRLTLIWHLKAIQHGTTEPERNVLTTVEVGSREYRDEVEYINGSYATGFPKDGRFCDAFNLPIKKILHSDDPVYYLDKIAQNPLRKFEQRNHAAQLLNHHIWPDPPRERNTLARDDIDVSEWVDAEMVRRKIPPTYFPIKCENCLEMECLADPDVLKRREIAVCMNCGEEQPISDPY